MSQQDIGLLQKRGKYVLRYSWEWHVWHWVYARPTRYRVEWPDQRHMCWGTTR